MQARCRQLARGLVLLCSEFGVNLGLLFGIRLGSALRLDSRVVGWRVW